ncbi:MAG: glycoside hydrolase family 38 C-terminal domain-containing protein, partial [Candidatus Cloacimonetes bacterium]|nr:glycoside hydrolase family 38 C-terminal domain-containing protein [Candidatus Cloacimonadota bacterium]
SKIAPGERWGKAWGSAWFKVRGKLPEGYSKCNIGLWFDCDGEACVFKNGSPWQGLTPKVDWYHNAAKHYVPLASFLDKQGSFELLIEAAANDLFGSGKDDYYLMECCLTRLNEEIFQVYLDLEVLFDLAQALPTGEVRRAKLIYGLNQCCNLYQDGKGLKEIRKVTRKLLSCRANASALTAFSIGHAHLDLAWLWPIRESKRKGGRTFANALRLLEIYPQYRFGASQAQLYQWISEQYPQLYREVKSAVKEGRWEVQGASWVEFDTNLISGESIIRQFLYGRRFFAREFGIEPACLWLPDCFGFSANLPQFMKGCNVEHFITQKLSWNESNTFPQHLFIWQGVDGSEVKAQQLPTNDYNFSNNPSAFKQTEARFAQAELSGGFLNLYGIGDGGGGPTRNHIEYGLRQQDLEGVCKFRFAKAQEFLDYYETIKPELLPKCYNELYLEFHRGTYTTQAKMKKHNVISERLLQSAEFLFALGSEGYPRELGKIWETVLLHQFHDILPGSSITKVYEDSAQACLKLHRELGTLIDTEAERIIGNKSPESDFDEICLINPCGAEKGEWIHLQNVGESKVPLFNGQSPTASYRDSGGLNMYVEASPWSISRLSFTSGKNDSTPALPATYSGSDPYLMENSELKVCVLANGSLSSILDKASGKELLQGESNQFLLWEDEPNNWGAWDINHFYRETKAQAARHLRLNEYLCHPCGYCRLSLALKIGNSLLELKIELDPGKRYLRFSLEIDWQERHKMLRVGFVPDVHSSQVNCGIQMANLVRSNRPQNQWEAARFEFPAQGYIDLSDSTRGFSLICGEKFGYSALENRMEMAILRSPADVDPKADLGSHTLSYAFYCHNSAFESSRVAQLSEALATGLLQYKPHGATFSWPEGRSLFGLREGKLMIKTIKPSESGRGIVLRLFEPLGCSVQDTLQIALPYSKIHKCNMLEEVLEELDPSLPLCARAFE